VTTGSRGKEGPATQRPEAAAATAPLLIAVPDGLSLGGVASWACATANTLAAAERVVGVIRHARRAGDTPIDTSLDARVRVFDASHLPPMDEALGACGVYETCYADALTDLSSAAGGLAVAAVPTQMGDCFGVFASLKARGCPLHLVGWRHSLSAYERAVMRHYAPWLSACVAISGELAIDCAEAAPGVRVTRLPHSVEPDEAERRDRDAGEPLRLIFVGRLEQTLKRAGLLPRISRELDAMGIAHRMRVVGDGELSVELRREAARNPSIQMMGTRSVTEVRELLRGSDLFLLPSRTEGLSLSLLEAMASGCVPVVTDTLSGVRETVTPETGFLVPFAEDPDEQARRFACAIGRAAGADLRGMSGRARRHTFTKHHPADYLMGVEALLAWFAATPLPHVFAGSRSPWFTSNEGGGSGTVPREAAERMRAVLRRLAGRKVLIHGTGRHTREVLNVIQSEGGGVVGYVEDDPRKIGSVFEGLPVYRADAIQGAGVEDVVVSSFIHRHEIAAAWRLRGGVRVHVLYGEGEEW